MAASVLYDAPGPRGKALNWVYSVIALGAFRAPQIDLRKQEGVWQ